MNRDDWHDAFDARCVLLGVTELTAKEAGYAMVARKKGRMPQEVAEYMFGLFSPVGGLFGERYDESAPPPRPYPRPLYR